MSDFYAAGEQWMAMAKKTGSLTTARFFPLHFGIEGSKDAVMAVIEARLTLDPDFRNKYRGWNFCAVRVDEVIRVGDDGAVRIARSEHQAVTVKDDRKPVIFVNRGQKRKVS